MSRLADWLTNVVYPALFAKGNTVLPEFEFVQKGRYWQANNARKIDGSFGNTIGKVYWYDNSCYGLKDYTRGFVSLWDYLKEDRGWDSLEIIRFFEQASNSKAPRDFSEEQARDYEERQGLSLVYEHLNDRFLELFHTDATASAQEVRNYCLRRGYKPEDVRQVGEDFGRAKDSGLKMELGIIPPKETVLGWIDELEIAESIRISAKLVWQENPTFGRSHILSTPFRDASGRIRGFMARNVFYQEDDIQAGPKYIYQKGLERSKVLFNFHRNRKQESVLLVEGPFDALHCTVRGIAGAIAVGGTSLNEEQIGLLQQQGVTKVILLMDNDAPGFNATYTILNQFAKQAPEIKAYVALLPEEINDPDECLQRYPPEVLETAIRKADAAWFYRIRRLFETHLLGTQVTDQERDALITNALREATFINDPIERDSFYAAFLDHTKGLQISYKSFRERAEKLRFDADLAQQHQQLKRMLKQAYSLAEEGDFERATRLVLEKQSEAISFGDTEKFLDLIKVQDEESFRSKLVNKPAALNTRFWLKDSIGMQHPLEIPSGAITIIPARTSHGKTTFSLNLLLNLALQYPDRNFHFFSYEEDSSAILMKLLNIFINQDLGQRSNMAFIEKYFKGEVDELASPKFLHAKTRFFEELINTGRIKIHYAPFEVHGLVRALSFIAERDRVGAIFIDYIQMLRIKGSFSSRQLELQTICNLLLNEVAVPSGLPLVLGAQFNREVQTEADMDSSKIREAGDIEQTANLIVSIWNRGFKGGREGNKDKTGREIPIDPKTIYVELLKNRDGQVGLSNELEFDGLTGKISNRANISAATMFSPY